MCAPSKGFDPICTEMAFNDRKIEWLVLIAILGISVATSLPIKNALDLHGWSLVLVVVVIALLLWIMLLVFLNLRNLIDSIMEKLRRRK
jgi:uncharacterized membrane protein AbrB (regulator of aidB expression)